MPYFTNSSPAVHGLIARGPGLHAPPLPSLTGSARAQKPKALQPLCHCGKNIRASLLSSFCLLTPSYMSHLSGFNPKDETTNADIINRRRVINGQDDGLMQVAPLKHPWADKIFKQMLANTWMPQEVQMAKDVAQWESAELTEQEQHIYKRALAFVSNLDGIQTENLTHNIARQITSPEVKLVVIRQAFEEGLHVHSYSTMVEALGLDPDEIYGLYRKDEELYRKNEYILSTFARIEDPSFKTGTPEADREFMLACVANVALEGIYFYSAFLVFYNFKRNNRMPGSAEMIQFINRDEDLHLTNFIGIIRAMKSEDETLWDESTKEKAKALMEKAVELEIAWGNSCIGDGILGLTPETLTEYIQFVGNIRMKSIGLEGSWPNATNPFPWIDEMTQGSMTETNFFEGKVREYASGTLEW